MSFAAVLLSSLLALPASDGADDGQVASRAPVQRVGAPSLPAGAARGWVFREVAESFRLDVQNQVRIEQHMSIRISPARPMTFPRNFLMDIPRRSFGPRLVERGMGRCVPVSSIAGVQPDLGSRLILFLRDRRMVSATLERACRARDFYSGFYVDRTDDGQLCVDRDTLLSRSGANCKLTRIRQLVDIDD